MAGVVVVNQPGAFLVDPDGNTVGVIIDGVVYRLQVEAKPDPDTLALLGSMAVTLSNIQALLGGENLVITMGGDFVMTTVGDLIVL